MKKYEYVTVKMPGKINTSLTEHRNIIDEYAKKVTDTQDISPKRSTHTAVCFPST